MKRIFIFTLRILLSLIGFILIGLYKVNAQAPTITSFSPTSGEVASTVIITGTGFNTTAINNIVFFGATSAIVTTASATSLTVTVPTGASFAPITVLNTSTTLSAYSTQFFNPTFSPNKGSFTSADMTAKTDFIVGSIPKSLAIGDLDGDGKPDIAIVNDNGIVNTVSIIRNNSINGIPSFGTKLTFSTGNNPCSVAVGDVNNDGKLDLAVVNYGSNGIGCSVSILRNIGSIGTISFDTKVDFTTGTDPTSLAFGDFNADGKPDLAITNFNGSSVSILRNNSNGSVINFATKVDFLTGNNPNSVSIGDINGDSKPDLAIACSYNNKVSVFRNTSSSSTINFAPKVDFTAGIQPRSVAICDIDGDNKLDLTVANAGLNGNGYSVSIFINSGSNGTVNFATKVDFATNNGPSYLAIGDIDGDGKPDLALGSSPTCIFRNTSSSGIVSLEPKVDFGTGSSTYSVALADLNYDGKLDLAIANWNLSTVSVFCNYPIYPPSITTIGNLTPFISCAGAASAVQTFIVSGNYLTANLVVTAPNGFEVSTTSGGGFGSSVILPQTSGIVNNTPIYIRLTSSTNDSSSGNVTCTSTGAPTQNIAIIGIVNATSTSISNANICPSQLPYSWNGRTYSSSKLDTIYLSNSVGCDSLTILNLTVKSTSTTNESICPSALPYIWNGLTFNTSGTQTARIIANGGCDSLATLNLTVKSLSTTNLSLCQSQLPYTWNGIVFNAAGTQTAHIIGNGGCDSLATLNLIIKPTSISITSINICQSQLPFNWNGQIYYSAKTDTVHLINSVGCDSSAIIMLSIKPTSTSTYNISICPNQLPYTWNGLNFTGAGSKTKTGLINSVGCDSSATLNLNVKSSSASTNNLSVCPSQLPYTWNGLNFTGAGSKTKTGLTNSVGCDSSATLSLSIKSTSTSTNNLSVCPSQLPYTWNGLNFTGAGSKTKTGLINAEGCDSSATLNLSIKSTIYSTNNLSICTSELPYTWNGLIFVGSDTKTKTGLISSAGCDSSATLILTVNSSPNTGNINGSSNVFRLDTASYSVMGTNGSIFNWSLAKGIIQSGAGTNQIQIKWNTVGTDTLKVIETSNQGCVGVQNTLLVNVSPASSINEIFSSKKISIYPNPTTGMVNISSNQAIDNIEVFDVTGKLVLSHRNDTHQKHIELDLSAFSNGIYLIQMQNQNAEKSLNKVVISK